MNQDLLEKIYRTYAGEIRLYLYSLCRNKYMAEDLMQEVFVKAILSLGDDHPNFKAWLYRVAHNICINYMKRNKNIVYGLSEGNAMDFQPWAESKYHRIIRAQNAAPKDEVSDKLFAKEKNSLLYKSMNKLTRPQKEVLFMMYFAELNTKEIAEVLALSPENVRVIAYRGRKELRKILEKEGYHEF